MSKMLFPYVVAVVLFTAIDLIWLGFVAKAFYRSELGNLMTDNFNLGAAVLFYFVYAAGLILFVVSPTLHSGTWRDALLLGAAFGFVAYATYDLSNLATLKGWPLKLTIVDLVWGTSLTAVVSSCVHVITRTWQQ